MFNLGIDIGGTAIKYGVVAPDHTIIEKGKIVTRKEDGEGAILSDIASLCRNLSEKYDIPAVGVGSPDLRRQPLCRRCRQSALPQHIYLRLP